MMAMAFLLTASATICECHAAAFISCSRLLGEATLIDKVRDGRLDILSVCLLDDDYRVDDPALLYHACANNEAQMLNMLLNDPKYIENVIDNGNFNVGNLAVGIALQHGHENLARYLLFLSEHDTFPLDVDFNNNQFVINAAANGQIDFLEDLLEFDQVDPDARNGTALILAILNGHTDVAILLSNDDRVDVARAHNTALATAVQVKNKLLIAVLLNRYEVRADCISALSVAAMNGDIDILLMLLNDENIEFSKGLITQTLMMANKKNLTDVIKVLLFDHRLSRSYLPLIAEENPDSFLTSEYGQFLVSCVLGDFQKASVLCPAEIYPEDLVRLQEHNPFVREFLENRNFI